MKEIEALERLAGLSRLRFQLAQSRMQAIVTKEQDLRTNLLQLTESKSRAARQNPDEDDPAFVAGADLRWHHWVDQRRAVINTELAQVLAEKAGLHAALQRAFGRDQAVRGLLAKQIGQLKKTTKRRALYDS